MALWRAARRFVFGARVIWGDALVDPEPAVAGPRLAVVATPSIARAVRHRPRWFSWCPAGVASVLAARGFPTEPEPQDRGLGGMPGHAPSTTAWRRQHCDSPEGSGDLF